MTKYTIIIFIIVVNIIFSQTAEEISNLIESNKLEEAELKLISSLLMHLLFL